MEHQSAVKGNDVTNPVARHFNELKQTMLSLFYPDIEVIMPRVRGGNISPFGKRGRLFGFLILRVCFQEARTRISQLMRFYTGDPIVFPVCTILYFIVF